MTDIPSPLPAYSPSLLTRETELIFAKVRESDVKKKEPRPKIVGNELEFIFAKVRESDVK